MIYSSHPIYCRKLARSDVTRHRSTRKRARHVNAFAANHSKYHSDEYDVGYIYATSYRRLRLSNQTSLILASIQTATSVYDTKYDNSRWHLTRGSRYTRYILSRSARDTGTVNAYKAVRQARDSRRCNFSNVTWHARNQHGGIAYCGNFLKLFYYYLN